MRLLTPLLISVSLLAGCAARDVDVHPVPGRISFDRESRDRATCKRLDRLQQNSKGFIAELARDCDAAFGQILDHNSSYAVFDVSRAYLDSLHDYVNAVDFLLAQNQEQKLRSNFGAYLIGREVGLIGAMQDWRHENGLRPHPELYTPARQVLV